MADRVIDDDSLGGAGVHPGADRMIAVACFGLAGAM